MKRRLVILASLLLVGCGSIPMILSNLSNIEDDLQDFRSSYIQLRAQIIAQQAIFPTEDWNTLIDVNNQFMVAQGVLSSFKAGGDLDRQLLTIEELTLLADPLLKAGRSVQAVFDRNKDKLTPESRDAYVQASFLFTEIDSQIDELLSNPEFKNTTQTLSRFLRAGNKLIEAIKIAAKVAL